MKTILMAIPVAMLMAGCDATPIAPERATGHDANVAATRADNATIYWNAIARQMVAEHGSSPFVATRTYTMVSLAQYNGGVAAATNPRGDRNAIVRAAITRASVDVLTHVYPAKQGALEEMAEAFLTSSRRGGDRSDEEQAGSVAGAAAAKAIIESRTGDGFNATWTGTVPTGPGIWFSSTVPPTAPVQPLLGQAKPFLLHSGEQFRPGPPPAFDSPEFLVALQEVRTVADSRTFREDSIAKFWAFPGGTYTPFGFWNDEAARLSARYNLTDLAAAHLFALMNMVGTDALIASHDAKYTYWLIRPSQADPGIQLAVGLPNFPAYVSNHSTLSAGMARIIGERFPSERRRLDLLAEEASMSRLYGGIHYRFDNETGLQLGRRIASWALDQDVKQGQPFKPR